MKIILIGKVNFTHRILKKIYSLNKNYLVGIVTDNNKKTNGDFVNLVPVCKKKKIPYLVSSNINSLKTYNWIKKRSPDYIFCFGYPKLIKGNLLKLYKDRIIGFHPTKLPFNRGRHPLIWSLLLNVRKSSCTFFYISKNADEGRIIDQTDFNIDKNANSTQLYNKVSKIAENKIKQVIMKISKGIYVKNKITLTNVWRKRSFDDGIIDWRMSVSLILSHIKALKPPYDYASFIYKDFLYQIHEAKKIKIDNKYYDEFGKVIKFTKKSFIVKCGDGYLEVLKTEPLIKFNNSKNIYL